jgi:hypothetical protein
MKLFDKNGLMYIPVAGDYKFTHLKEVVLVKECFCSNGHNLISKQARFGDYDGIVLDVEQDNQLGKLALSPIFGDKSRVSFNIVLKDNQLVKLLCPKCKSQLPVYGACDCGADLVVMFTGKLNDFNNCVGICNRVGCKHSEIKNEGQLMTLTYPEIL